MKVEYVNGGTPDHHGPLILYTLSDHEGTKPVREQLDEGYAHGGGWKPFGQGKWTVGPKNELCYPGDPPLPPRVFITFDNFPQTLVVYDHAWFALFEPGGKVFEVCRMN